MFLIFTKLGRNWFANKITSMESLNLCLTKLKRSIYLSKSLQFTAIIFLFIGFSSDVKSQAREFGEQTEKRYESKKGKFDFDRMRYGGSFGATFGDITYVDIAPTAGYMLTDNLLFGLSGRYIYFEERFLSYRFSTNIYGGGPFTQYFILENITLHAEYEVLNMVDRNRYFYNPNQAEKRINVSSLLVGVGYRTMINRRSFASILLLYNLNENENSIYTNPIIRLNFGFGI